VHEAHGYIELFTHAPSFRRVVLCCAIQASIQMTGVSAIQYYSPTIYKLVGIGTGQALKYQGISSALGLLGEACCMLTVDKIGRRWTLIGFNLLNMCTFIGATAIIGYYPLTGAAASVPTSAAYAFIAMTILYNFSFSWGCGPLSWVSLVSNEHRAWLSAGDVHQQIATYADPHCRSCQRKSSTLAPGPRVSPLRQ